MLYALIQNDSVSVYPYSINEFRQANPNVSLPETPTEQQLNEVNIFVVLPTPVPEYNTITQNCNQGTPEKTQGSWFQTWIVTDATAEEILVREQSAKNANKQEASSLLTETDWTTIPDVGDQTKSNPYLSNVNEFVTYRNEVRAIALNPPITVDIWPTKPVEIWLPVEPQPV